LIEADIWPADYLAAACRERLFGLRQKQPQRYKTISGSLERALYGPVIGFESEYDTVIPPNCTEELAIQITEGMARSIDRGDTSMCRHSLSGGGKMYQHILVPLDGQS
jgi:hypothetical protein